MAVHQDYLARAFVLERQPTKVDEAVCDRARATVLRLALRLEPDESTAARDVLDALGIATTIGH